jgi:hypothetical protein
MLQHVEFYDNECKSTTSINITHILDYCCKSSSSLVDLIDTNVDLEEELEELERTFERDEIMEFYI